MTVERPGADDVEDAEKIIRCEQHTSHATFSR